MVDEATVAVIAGDDGSAADPCATPLDARRRASLALADALMTRPDALGEDDRIALRAMFRQVERAELVLDVLKWSHQKSLVALGADRPVDPDRPTMLSFADDGRAVIHRDRH